MADAYTTLISAESLQSSMDDAWRIIDCRFDITQPDWGQMSFSNGHITNALYSDLDKDLSGKIDPLKTGRHPLPTKSEWLATVESWGITKDTQVIAYDQGPGAYAARLWWMLKWIGHEKVAVLDGGLNAWMSAGFDLSKEPTQFDPSKYTPAWQDHLLVYADQITQGHLSSDDVLVDVRDLARYAGWKEPLDFVAGHIPGAVNRPYKYDLDDNGQRLSFETLSEQYKDDFILDKNIICYCGSGVTACHKILTINHLTGKMPRLYAGSWSHWITDIQRPVEVVEE